jgi:tRNA-2-methylthio-N6-dimethylallyladenosine synthase
MQGCNQHCTFCIVPSTRGLERSRPIDDIVSECRELVDQGVREITLLGQIVTSYGKREIGSQNGKSAFVQLLEAVHEVDGLQRIRFTSPHPKGYGDDLVQAYADLPKLVESAHIPVQSGSDRMLKAMHRGYTRERFLNIIQKLRSVHPGMGISTDIIVGFPGETEEDFEQTVSLMKEVEFDQAFIFRYSKRKDTPAADMGNQLPEEVKNERNQTLLKVVDETARKRLNTFVGRQVQILVEGPSKRNATRMSGRTRCNKIVVFEGDERHRGELMDVEIEKIGSFTLYGNPAVLMPN